MRLFSYDQAHQLTGVRTDAGTHTFVYDDAGFLTREVTVSGVVREYFYDAAGQLVRLQDSESGVCELVYDGLGRRVQQTAADGSVRSYSYSPVGLLGQISTASVKGSATAEDETDALSVVRLWNDALGQVASITSGQGSCDVVWDPVAWVPTALGVNDEVLSLSAAVSVDVLGARGVDPFAASPLMAGADAGDVLGSAPGFAGVGLTVAGSLRVGALEVLGARAYDPGTRGFVSPDPLTSPVGAGWASNVYAFAGFDPVSQVDPWGLSPMTASQFREYRADTSSRATERRNKGIGDGLKAAGEWVKDNWQGIAMVAAGVAATALLGPLGGAIVGGAYLRGFFLFH